MNLSSLLSAIDGSAVISALLSVAVVFIGLRLVLFGVRAVSRAVHGDRYVEPWDGADIDDVYYENERRGLHRD